MIADLSSSSLWALNWISDPGLDSKLWCDSGSGLNCSWNYCEVLTKLLLLFYRLRCDCPLLRWLSFSVSCIVSSGCLSALLSAPDALLVLLSAPAALSAFLWTSDVSLSAVNFWDCSLYQLWTPECVFISCELQINWKCSNCCWLTTSLCPVEMFSNNCAIPKCCSCDIYNQAGNCGTGGSSPYTLG